MTHREFYILCEENVERTHDENEREAMYAIMYAVASRGKGKQGKIPQVQELYKRPTGETEATSKVEDMFEKQKQAEEWLSKFDLSKLGKEE